MVVTKLHDVLFQKKMNRAELSEKANVNENWLSKLYHGKLGTIHVESMQRVCNVLEVKQIDIIEIVPDLPEGQNHEVSAPVGNKELAKKKRGLFRF